MNRHTLARTTKIAVLLVLYVLVAALAWVFASSRRALAATCVALVALVVVALIAWRDHPPAPALHVATYNIRCFGTEPTDMDRLTAIVSEVAPDVMAVQEVQSEARIADLAQRLTARSGGRRAYAYVLASCGGRSAMRVGFLYDARRARLRAVREYPELDPDGEGSCTEGDRAGLLGAFDDGARAPLELLAVHLAAGSEPERVERRRAQWARAHRIAAGLHGAGHARVVILGDVNSTGWLDNRGAERDYIDARARENGMAVATAPLACSEYWRPAPDRFEPSLLDHVVAPPGLVRDGSVRVHGYCAALACAPHRASEPPADYATVSDHCPVAFDLAR
jgi:endonuclease/exonuclease/phosphatase family metal-dependent hydrolase